MVYNTFKITKKELTEMKNLKRNQKFGQYLQIRRELDSIKKFTLSKTLFFIKPLFIIIFF